MHGATLVAIVVTVILKTPTLQTHSLSNPRCPNITLVIAYYNTRVYVNHLVGFPSHKAATDKKQVMQNRKNNYYQSYHLYCKQQSIDVGHYHPIDSVYNATLPGAIPPTLPSAAIHM